MASDIDRLVEMHVDSIEHAGRTQQPATAFSLAGNNVMSEARKIFAEELGKLDQKEVSAAFAFFTSSTGRKEIKAADAVGVNLQTVLQGGNPLVTPIDTHVPKVEELIKALDFETTLDNMPGSNKIPTQKIREVFSNTYASLLSPSEVDELISFHKSEVGKKYTEASNKASARVAELALR